MFFLPISNANFECGSFIENYYQNSGEPFSVLVKKIISQGLLYKKKNLYTTGNPAAEGTGYVFMKFLSRILFYFILHVLVCRVINENVFKSSANIEK